MKKTRYVLEYLLLICASWPIRWLPRGLALLLAVRLGDFAYYCLPIRKRLVVGNLSRSFPDKTPLEIRRIARDVYRNFAKTAIEQLRLAGMGEKELMEIVRIDGKKHLQAALDRGRGTILVGGHFGNWEYMLTALAAAGYPLSVVAADINNPLINKMIQNNRLRTGVALLPKKGSLLQISSILKKNEIIGLIMDQDARKRGIFIDFLGRPASTTKGPAKLTLSHGAALLFAIPIRNADDSITVKILPIDTNGFDSADAESVKELTRMCSQTLEAYVRDFPDQWFWLHRRWKTRPPEERQT